MKDLYTRIVFFLYKHVCMCTCIPVCVVYAVIKFADSLVIMEEKMYREHDYEKICRRKPAQILTIASDPSLSREVGNLMSLTDRPLMREALYAR